MRFSVCDMKSTITGWPLAAAHGNLTPAHTDECAAADELAQHADELHTGDEGHAERCREKGETAC